jgi:hypothetical protein
MDVVPSLPFGMDTVSELTLRAAGELSDVLDGHDCVVAGPLGHPGAVDAGPSVLRHGGPASPAHERSLCVMRHVRRSGNATKSERGEPRADCSVVRRGLKRAWKLCHLMRSSDRLHVR